MLVQLLVIVASGFWHCRRKDKTENEALLHNLGPEKRMHAATTTCHKKNNMYMYIYIHTYIYIYIHIHIHTNMSVYTHTSMFIYLFYTHISVYAQVLADIILGQILRMLYQSYIRKRDHNIVSCPGPVSTAWSVEVGSANRTI